MPDNLKYLELKAELLVEGVGATAEALEGLGTVYKEQNHGLFGWDFDDHVGKTLPDDFLLPDGTVVQFRHSAHSPYQVRKADNGLILFKQDEPVSSIAWLPRPSYYEKKTARDNRMVTVGQTGGEDCLFFCYQNYCSHFSKDEQCLFCNLVSTSQTYDSVLRKKDADDIGDVAAAAFTEGTVKHVLLTGGCFNHQKEIELVGEIMKSIRAHTGMERIPGTILPSPAKSPDDAQRYFDTGIKAIGFSMEIWDKKLYEAICPGKAASTGHNEFVAAIERAVKVFGAGNVYGVFVMGLEPRATFLDGVKTLTSIGANIVPFVWSPNPGSKLEGHRAPGSRWFVETALEGARIVRDAGVPSGTENHCFKCDGNSLLHDALRLNGIT